MPFGLTNHAPGAPAPAQRMSEQGIWVVNGITSRQSGLRHCYVGETSESSGGKPTIEYFNPYSGPGAAQWVKDFQRWAAVADIKPANYAKHFKWYVGDRNIRDELEAIPKRPGDSMVTYYMRLVLAFVEKHQLSPAILRQLQSELRNIHKGPTENISDFNDRIRRCIQVARPDVSLDSEVAFNDYLMALNGGFRRMMATCVHVDDAEMHAAGWKKAPGLTYVSTWADLTSIAVAYYRNRSQRDAAEENTEQLAEYHAKSKVKTASSGQQEIAQLDGKYQGTHGHTKRVHRDAHSLAAFSNPAPDKDAMHAYERTVKDTQALERIAHQAYRSKRKRGETDLPRDDTGKFVSRKKNRGERKSRVGGKKMRDHHHDSSESESESDTDYSSDEEDARPARRARMASTTPPAEAARQALTPRAPAPGGAGKRPPPQGTSGGRGPPSGGAGPCSNCCLPHDFSTCSRNPLQGNVRAQAYLDKGPHPRATDADIATVVKKHGPFAVDESAAARSAGSMKQERPVRKANRITIGPQGQSHVETPLVLAHQVRVQGLVDSGSEVTLMSRTYYQEHRDAFGRMRAPPQFDIQGMSGAPSRTIGTLTIPTTVLDPPTGLTYTKQHDYIVMDALDCPLIIGMDLLARFYYDMTFHGGHLTVRADLIPDQGRVRGEEASNTSPITAIHTTSIPAGVGKSILVKYGAHLQVDPLFPVVCQPIPMIDSGRHSTQLAFVPHIQNKQSLLPSGRYWLYVLNPGLATIEVTSGTQVGRAQATAPDTLRAGPRGLSRGTRRVHLAQRTASATAADSMVDVDEAGRDGAQ